MLVSGKKIRDKKNKQIDIADTVYCVFLHMSSALLQSVIYD